ncbi:MAG: hypothetical protein GY859_11895, partial [Desulfobacterales bacterium]|nr:hypothetical protein [Desulfobacterales bacterium]
MSKNKRGEDLLKKSGRPWIISSGEPAAPGEAPADLGEVDGPCVAYRVSDLGKYMLSSDPIELSNYLTGCEVRYRKPGGFFGVLLSFFKRLLGWRDPRSETEVILFLREPEPSDLKDPDLEAHLKKARGMLREYHPAIRRLEELNPEEIADIVGLCEDVAGNRTRLNLQGDVYEKLDYVLDFIGGDVEVILRKPHMADGLFEMRGFDFESFDPDRSYLLLKYTLDGKPEYRILDHDGKETHRAEDDGVVFLMQVLENSLQSNPHLLDSFKMCAEGRARPMKLLFNKALEIDYSKTEPPPLYKRIFEARQMNAREKAAVLDSLRRSQLGVSFNYIPNADSGEETLCTSISVMHDLRELESIKSELPRVYAEISRRARASEAGCFYLLEA